MRVLILGILLITALNVRAQQNAQFTQYMDNTLFLNPAYAGSNGMLNMTALHREQWFGVAGRPQSSTFSIHSPLRFDNVGLGFTAVNDIVGPIQSTKLYGDFSYTLKFKNNKGKLAFGIKGGANVNSSKTDQLSTSEGQDQALLDNAGIVISPSFGAGVYYHMPKWFVGVSSPNFLEGKYPGTNTRIENRHYFFISGAVFDIAPRWKLRPTTHVKMTNGAPISVDLSLAAIYNKKIWLGAMHRFNDSFGAFVQYQITNQFKVGMAYDQTVTEFAGYNKGTYEVLLSYDFVFKNKGIRSPRYF